MEFDGFEWDSGNRDKCQSHGASVDDIESIFAHRVLIIHDHENSVAEQRFRAIGTTSNDRKLFVVFTMRGHKIRPLSARFMHQREIDRYEKDNSEL